MNYIDLVNDLVNDPVNNLEYIIELIRNNPGINTTKIHNILKKEGSKASMDILKNVLKRRLNEFIEFRGPFKTGGYYIKKEYKNSNNAIITNHNNTHINDLVNDLVNDQSIIYILINTQKNATSNNPKKYEKVIMLQSK